MSRGGFEWSGRRLLGSLCPQRARKEGMEGGRRLGTELESLKNVIASKTGGIVTQIRAFQASEIKPGMTTCDSADLLGKGASGDVFRGQQR